MAHSTLRWADGEEPKSPTEFQVQTLRLAAYGWQRFSLESGLAEGGSKGQGLKFSSCHWEFLLEAMTFSKVAVMSAASSPNSSIVLGN